MWAGDCARKGQPRADRRNAAHQLAMVLSISWPYSQPCRMAANAPEDKMKRTAATIGLFLSIATIQAAPAQDPMSLTVLAGGQTKTYAVDDLRAIESIGVTTSTPWTEGAQSFVGVSGPRFVEAAGITAATVAAVALNDYQVEIPLEVLNDPNLLIAYERNGAPMSVRDKGPFWIVFPYDQMPEYLGDAYISYSIWNLARMEETE
jgi:hypothetical protein